jgi:hypothetical protein
VKSKDIYKTMAIVVVGWLSGYLIAENVFMDSSAVTGYALLCGWFFTAYLAAKFNGSLAGAICVVFIVSGISFCWGISGSNLFYHDIHGAGIIHIFIISMAHGVMVSSPAFFNLVFDVWVGKLEKMVSY